MNQETVCLILIEDLGMRKICVKMILRNLTDQQRTERRDVSADLLEQVEFGQGLLNWVITGGKSWFYQYFLETKRQSSEWRSLNSLRSKKPRLSKSKVECTLVYFFYSNSTVYSVDASWTNNYYLKILDKLWKKWIIFVRSSLVFGTCITMCSFSTLSLWQFLANKGIPILP